MVDPMSNQIQAEQDPGISFPEHMEKLEAFVDDVNCRLRIRFRPWEASVAGTLDGTVSFVRSMPTGAVDRRTGGPLFLTAVAKVLPPWLFKDPPDLEEVLTALLTEAEKQLRQRAFAMGVVCVDYEAYIRSMAGKMEPMENGKPKRRLIVTPN